MTQVEYLAILFSDLGFDRLKRNAWLTHQFKRPIAFLDELVPTERSYVINRLKEMKEEQHVPRLR